MSGSKLSVVGSGPRLRLPQVSERHHEAIRELSRVMDGEVRDDATHRAMYATDASLYEVLPVAVAMPKSTRDFERIVAICAEHDLPLTIRTAGTSLAGQAVGPGLVVDSGRYLTQILELDLERRTVRVQPGVIRDELNRHLAPHGLLFGPDTSTSNRCMVGGMVGNNSCGAHSILYGSTRDHLESVEVVLTDAKRHLLGRTSREQWQRLSTREDRLGEAVRVLERVVRDNATLIGDVFPRPEIKRRNTGFPLDDLAASWLGHDVARDPNLARFLCGTEGTLAVTTEATLGLVPAPRRNLVVAAHFESVEQALLAAVESVRHAPAAVELMDKRILDLAALNANQQRNRWFLEGDPGAILVIELYGDADADLEARAQELIDALRRSGLGYAWPIIRPPRIESVWALRRAGLGVLFGKPGDVKPVTLIEDTAVVVQDLPAYISDLSRLMAEHRTECVYYAHAGAGELHLRPELNLKDRADVERARAIATEVTDLVKSYRGAISGEHGDGRLRGPFLRQALGDEAYELLVQVKRAFDPDGMLNPDSLLTGKPFDSDWRFGDTYEDRSIPTEFVYQESGGFQRAVERCNGAGVCRRTAAAGGTMCPSYMATLEERESTRGRANLFRLLIQQGPDAVFGSSELREALDLCLSCKGCRSDCPASVDMAKLKAEFLQGYLDRNGVPYATRAFASVTELSRPVQRVPGLARAASFVQGTWLGKRVLSSVLGIDSRRSMPAIAPRSFRALLAAHRRAVPEPDGSACLGTVCLFVDELTDRYESHLAMAAVQLLEAGGYRVVAPKLAPSGRTYLSKGLVRAARQHIEDNIATLRPIAERVDAIVGIEPSAVLTMVDEAIDLPRDQATRDDARVIAAKIGMVEGFVASAVEAGRWRTGFTPESARVLLHGHCQQKALLGMDQTLRALSLPPGYEASLIDSSCCGMAGSFGYEAKHYELSMAIGELSLFPAVRAAPAATLIAAPGTSCRHQIHDGTGRRAHHPVEILLDAIAR